MLERGGGANTPTHKHTNTDTHTQTCVLGISSAVSPPQHSPAPFPSLSHRTDSPKHLHRPDLVPLGTGSGPLAADSKFLARIKPPNGSHSEMIYTALLYTPAPCSPLLMVYYTDWSLSAAYCWIWRRGAGGV